MVKKSLLERVFKLSQHNTTIKTEIIAGFTTFMTIAYILIVNPIILEEAGMDFGAVFTATALTAAVATIIMALLANLPFVLAPGMGLNAFFAYVVVQGMGYSWEFALTAVFLEGIIFLALTFLNVREAIINFIPMTVKNGISTGIGFFIAFIGLKNGGIIVADPDTFLALGNVKSGGALLAVIGILITGALLAKGFKGALLIGMMIATIIGIPLGVTDLASFNTEWLFRPPSLAPTLFKLDFANIISKDMLVVLFTFLFVDMFDTVGTLIGVSTKSGMLTEDGKVPNAKQALFADAVGTTMGALTGTSTVTTCVESAAGVAEGGRTGLTALTAGILFALSLFLAPIFLLVPSAATAPALVLVGLFMLSPIKDIDLDDYTEAIPAFLTIIMMPFGFSIAHGIVFGVLSYAIIKLISGRGKEVAPVTYLIAVFLLGSFFI